MLRLAGSAAAVLRREPDSSQSGRLRMSRTCHRLRPRDISGRHRLHQEEGEASMAIQRMDNVGIVVEDVDAAIAFFVELGMELEGRTEVEGPVADQCTGLDGVHCDIAMLRTPDGHSRLELAKYRSPEVISPVPRNRPHNVLGTHRVMFAVDDIEDTVARLHPHGAELLGRIARFEDSYLLCYVRGPEGIIVGLAEQLR
jgi:catechol 2,3-dioxygenase-like lactoylglutathione lyase family enzyme